jgi:alanine transaminase
MVKLTKEQEKHRKILFKLTKRAKTTPNDISNLIEEYDIPYNIKNKIGENMLFNCIKSVSNIELIRFLQEKGCDLDARRDGSSLFDMFYGAYRECLVYLLVNFLLFFLGGSSVFYYLDESNDWTIDFESLETNYDKAVKNGIDVKLMVVINPGNPTGAVFTKKTIESIVKFCYKNKILLLADEVYQDNIYGNIPFVSFRKVINELKLNVSLVSFHSASKGIAGECGKRSGYMELLNVSSTFLDQIFKMVSINLCSNIDGQIMLGLIVNPPKPNMKGVFDKFTKEYTDILNSLKYKAKLVAEILNSFDGVVCNTINGSMYAYPSIEFPTNAIIASKKNNCKAVDEFYCLRLLNETGICVVPGSGFGQKKGSYHIRLTILPSKYEMISLLEKMRIFHKNFMDIYMPHDITFQRDRIF